MKRTGIFAIVLAMVLAFSATDSLDTLNTLEAKGSSFKSSPSRSYSSKPSRSYSSKPSKSYSSKPKATAGSTKSKYTTKPLNKSSVTNSAKPTTKTVSKQQAARQNTVNKEKYATAQKSGKVFKTKEAASKDFATKSAGKYESKYTSKPSTRPDHIPSSTSVGGNTYNVSYNQSHGGYGYTNALGAYIMYDMMSDSIMRNRMMMSSGYHISGPPIAVMHTPVQSGFGFMLSIFGGIALIVVIFIMMKV